MKEVGRWFEYGGKCSRSLLICPSVKARNFHGLSWGILRSAKVCGSRWINFFDLHYPWSTFTSKLFNRPHNQCWDGEASPSITFQRLIASWWLIQVSFPINTRAMFEKHPRASAHERTDACTNIDHAWTATSRGARLHLVGSKIFHAFSRNTLHAGQFSPFNFYNPKAKGTLNHSSL